MSWKTADPPAAPPAAAEGADVGALNLAWSARFADALVAAGVRDVVIAPGSRSAPLVLAFHASGARTRVALDERAGAFFALGLAKASGRPVAIVTTSGTAAANLVPAAVEARHGRVPLVLLTADRPPELRDTGAPQTIDQVKLFGGIVRWFCEVGAPSGGPGLLEYAASLGTRAAAEAWGPPRGPVHLNFAFREPLIPEPEAMPDPARRGRAIRDGADGPDPAPPAGAAIERLARLIRTHPRGLIVCGPDDPDPAFAAAVARLAAGAGYPVLADPASQVRFGPHDRTRILDAYDAFLRSDAFAGREAPELLLQFGAPLTSKAYQRYSARHPGAVRVVVDPAGSPRDPTRLAREILHADGVLAASALADALAGTSAPGGEWSERFVAADRVARRALAAAVAAGEAPIEGALFAALVAALPPGSILYAGNSMPVRDLDTFAPASERPLRVLVNRGASGIDGLVSSALGAGAALDAPVVCVAGDLSFHHDLNALHLARGAGGRAAVILIHNDGGGIFSFLPVARHGEIFEPYFGTPHGLDFEAAAALYGVSFSRARGAADAAEGAARAAEARETRIVQLRTDRERNREAHEAVTAAVLRAVEGAR